MTAYEMGNIPVIKLNFICFHFENRGKGMRCSSVVRVSIHGASIELFLIPASAPRLV